MYIYTYTYHIYHIPYNIYYSVLCVFKIIYLDIYKIISDGF